METIDDLLIKASERGDVYKVERLLAAGADVHARDDEALLLAIYYGRWNVVEILRKAMNDINYLLTEASDRGDLDTVKRMLEAGADVHTHNDRSLRLASEKGHEGVVEILLENGADVHACLDWALRLASNNGHTAVVKLLIAKGAGANAWLLLLALLGASEKGNEDVVKILRRAMGGKQ
jgi:ankyrin repeat protein